MIEIDISSKENSDLSLLLEETEAHMLLQTKRSVEVASDDEAYVEEGVSVSDNKLPADYYDCCYIGCRNAFHGPCDVCKDECGKDSEYCQEHYEHEIHQGKNKNALLVNQGIANHHDEKKIDLIFNGDDQPIDPVSNEDNEFKKLYSLLMLVKIVSHAFIYNCFFIYTNNLYYSMQRPMNIKINLENESITIPTAIYPKGRYSIGLVFSSVVTLYNLHVQCDPNDPLKWDLFNDQIHFVSQSNHPVFYHYDAFNGRTCSQGKTAHIFPAKLKLKNSPKFTEKRKANNKIPFETDEFIGLQLWKTRCNNPRLDLIVYGIGSKQIYLIHNCLSFLRSHVCDLEFDFGDVNFSDVWR